MIANILSTVCVLWYLGLLWAFARGLFTGGSILARYRQFLLICAVGLHGLLCIIVIFPTTSADFSVGGLLLCVTCAVAYIVLFHTRDTELDALVVLVFIVSGCTILFNTFAMEASSVLVASQGSTFTHIFLSVTAYAVLGLAAIQTTIFSLLQIWLRGKHLMRIVAVFPPLDRVEKLNFRLLTIGMYVLTFTIASGLFLFWDLLAAGGYRMHMSVALLAWVLYGGVLIGQKVAGWHGGTTNVLSIMAFIILTISYFGLRFANTLFA